MNWKSEHFEKVIFLTIATARKITIIDREEPIDF
jgi:hypothetical protein